MMTESVTIRSTATRLCVLALSSALALCGPSCSKRPSSERHQRTTLRVLNWSEVQTLDPARISWLVDIRAADLLFDGLTEYDPETLKPRPCIAERWEISPDRRQYTFYLRRDARWTTGEPVTAHDFVWSWKRILQPETAADYVYLMFVIKNAERYHKGLVCAAMRPEQQAAMKKAGRFVEPIDFSEVGIRAIDDYTLQVTLESPVPYFLDLTSFITFKPVHRRTIERFTLKRDGRVIGTDPAWYLQPENLVCNGPYVLETWRPKQLMRFRRRPDHWAADRIKTEVIEIIPVESRSTAFAMYEQGEADIMPFSPPRRIAESLIRAARAGKRRDVHVTPAFGTYFYRFNCRRKPFDDPRVRIAFARAVDRNLIARKVCWLGEQPAESFVPPGTADYRSPEMPSFDPAAARRLLAEAGYPDGRGLPTIEIMFNKDQTGHQSVAEAIKDMWQRYLGVRVELLSVDRGTFREKLKNLDYFVARGGWYGDYDDPMTFLEMFVTAPPEGGGNNDTGFSDPEYDDLIARAKREPDPQKRNRLLYRAEQILIVEKMPIMPLYHYVEMYLFDPERVKGFRPNKRGINPLRYVWLAR